jgi:hypothetical protein
MGIWSAQPFLLSVGSRRTRRIFYELDTQGGPFIALEVAVGVEAG